MSENSTSKSCSDKFRGEVWGEVEDIRKDVREEIGEEIKEVMLLLNVHYIFSVQITAFELHSFPC